VKKLVIITTILMLIAPAIQAQNQRRIEIKPVDRDGDGRFTPEEMCDGITGPMKPAILETLKKLDVDGDGFITKEEISSGSGKPAKRGPTATDDECAGTQNGTCKATVNPKSGKTSYAVLISAKTYQDKGWKAVADALVKKHTAHLVIYDYSVLNAKDELRKLSPRYLAVITRPEITGRVIVQRLHQLTRDLDDDPYGDAVWGLITAATPERALEIIQSDEPKKVESSLNLTGVNNSIFKEVFTISDGKMGEWYWKKRDGTEERGDDGNADRTAIFLKRFMEMKPDLIVSSGHATEKNLEMCFSRGNTVALKGRWYIRSMDGKTELIPESSHPRVFMGAGNCLIGNMNRTTNSMACTLISHYGFNQFVGYTVPTWYGKGGWGTLGLWQSEGGYSLADAWFFNNQVILHELQTRFPEASKEVMAVSEDGEGFPMDMNRKMERDASGMIWDRDVVAFYGDPMHRIITGSRQAFETQLKKSGASQLLTIKAQKDLKGGPAICVWLPEKIKGLQPAPNSINDLLVTDDYIIVLKPDCKAGEELVIKLTTLPAQAPK
jgi:zinc protease